MNKRLWIILVSSIFLIILLSIVYILWINPLLSVKINKAIQPKSVTTISVPSELGESFDPTISHSTFLFLEDLGNQELKLERVFPNVVANQTFRSQLVCDKSIKVQLSNNKYDTSINLEELFSLFIPKNGPIYITGLCGDTKCTTITGECNIFLSGLDKI